MLLNWVILVDYLSKMLSNWVVMLSNWVKNSKHAVEAIVLKLMMLSNWVFGLTNWAEMLTNWADVFVTLWHLKILGWLIEQ